MQTAESFHGEQSRDKPRHRAMVKMIVRNRNTANLTLFGNKVPIGECEIAVYEDDAAKVKEQVESDSALIAAAEREYVREIADELKSRLESAVFNGTTADLVKLLAEPDKLSGEIAERYAKVLATTNKSMPGAFHRLHGRGLLPLDSAEVIEGSEFPEYHRKVQLDEATALQKMLHSALAGVATPAAPAAPAITAADIAEMIKQGVRDGVREELARMKSASKPEAKG